MKDTKRTLLSIIITLTLLPIWSQQVQIVNMVPNAQSNETARDREPNLAINPANPLQMVGTAFTPNPLGATTPPSAPIYFSLDGGQTWVLNSIVPSGSLTSGTGDITTKFGTTTNWLYSGILRSPPAAGANRTMDILRTNNVAGTALMQLLTTRNQPDQPYIHVATALSGPDTGNDRVYVGNNDLGVTGQTATSDQTMSGEVITPIPTFNTVVLEQRTTAGQDMPPVRTVSHTDGTVYIAFERATTITLVSAGQWTIVSDVIVVRDDNWGNSATPYSDLLDPGDGIAGRIVATGITYTFTTTTAIIGQERIGSRLNIVVDPNNSNLVYIAWGDNNPGGGNSLNLHLRRSIDGGANWSAADIRTINNAINPELAINSLGEVMFSYQQLTAGNWQTITERSTNNFATITTATLNTFPDNTPTGGGFFPYLGDYAYLTAMPSGKDFVGVFSASNDPAPARFPTVQPIWQRNINPATNQLRNLANTGNIAVSIDPYFYRVSPVAIDDDFYVRDWTTTTTSKDLGEEPSTNPVFYRTSDIWNRRSDTPGAFNANDQPDNQDPQPVTTGPNFAYARVHRGDAGAAANVGMLFLKSEFGTGSNYQLINGVSSFSSLSFSATDVQQTMAAGVQWNLIDPAAVTANHVCMAVEIAGPDDPSSNPTLLGRSPGWSNGTDLLVMADNNKAQRNLGVYTGPLGSGAMTMYAVAHNAALFKRDMLIVLNPYATGNDRVKYNISVISGKEGGEAVFRGDSLILRNMKPCENRWIEFSVHTMPALNAEPASYLFEERVNEMKINGFGIDIKSGKLAGVGEENLGEHAFLFERLVKQFEVPDAQNQAKIAHEILENGANEPDYILFMEEFGAESVKIVEKFIENQGSDPFAAAVSGNNFLNKIESKNWDQAAMAHGNFARKVNAYLSYLDKSDGDVADIIQTNRWFKDIVKRSETFKHSKLADESIAQADKFIVQYSKRELLNKDYPSFVRENLPLWMELVRKHIPDHDFENSFLRMRDNLRNPKHLQKFQCEFVMELSNHVVF
ncbi:MAG: hypothetical protein ABFS38_20795 [Bacteroidota bacterium]